jgi:uncharacterized protein YfiM (DUF2279 family)
MTIETCGPGVLNVGAMIAEPGRGHRDNRRRSPALLAGLVALLAAAPARAQPGDPNDAQNDRWLGNDKALHFGASFTLAAGGYLAVAPVVGEPVVRFGSAALLAATAGVAKEMHDRVSGGDPSLRDLAWDGIGTAAGLVVGWLVGRYLLGDRRISDAGCGGAWLCPPAPARAAAAARR